MQCPAEPACHENIQKIAYKYAVHTTYETFSKKHCLSHCRCVYLLTFKGISIIQILIIAKSYLSVLTIRYNDISDNGYE